LTNDKIKLERKLTKHLFKKSIWLRDSWNSKIFGLTWYDFITINTYCGGVINICWMSSMSTYTLQTWSIHAYLTRKCMKVSRNKSYNLEWWLIFIFENNCEKLVFKENKSNFYSFKKNQFGTKKKIGTCQNGIYYQEQIILPITRNLKVEH